MSNRHMKKMLKVTHHQGNANQNHNEVSCCTLVRMGKIKKTRKITYWGRYGGKTNSSTLLVGTQIGIGTMKDSRSFLEKSKIELPCDPLLGIYTKNIKTLIRKKYMHPYVYCSITYNSQIIEAPKCP